MEWLAREEAVLALGSLAASGTLVLGVLELIWPTRRPRPARHRRTSAPRPPARRAAPAAAPPTPAADVGREIVQRALAEPDDARRVRRLSQAVAWLERVAAANPDDARARAALCAARSQLWRDYERIALARLAASMPWGTTALAATESASGAAASGASSTGAA